MAIVGKDKDPSRADRKAKKRKAEDAIPDLPGDNNDEGQSTSTEQPSKKHKRNIEVAGGKAGGMNGEIPKKGIDEKNEKKIKKVKAGAGRGLDFTEGMEGVPLEIKHKKSTRYSAVGVDEETALEKRVVSAGDDMPRKSKKERKAERKAKESTAAASRAPATVETEATIAEVAMPASATVADGVAAEPTKSKKNNRNREKNRKNVNLEPVTGAGGAAKADKKADRFIVFIGIA